METGERFPVYFSFRLPGGERIKITYDVQLEGEDPERRLLRVRLGAWRDLAWPPAQAADPEIIRLLDGLVGTHAHIPEEARHGTRLPMKYETLTRQMRYFDR